MKPLRIKAILTPTGYKELTPEMDGPRFLDDVESEHTDFFNSFDEELLFVFGDDGKEYSVVARPAFSETGQEVLSICV